MRRVRVIILAAIVSAPVLCSAAFADPAGLPKDQDRGSPYMRVFGVTQPPYGFVQFCERVPEECRQGQQEEQRFPATAERLRELAARTRTVNGEIALAADMEIYSVAEYSTMPTTRGHSEVSAL